MIVRDWLFDARERRAGASGSPGKNLAGNRRKERGNLPLNVIIRIMINMLVRGGGSGISNPRYGFPYTHFPGVRLQPLGHPSEFRSDRARRRAAEARPHAVCSACEGAHYSQAPFACKSERCLVQPKSPCYGAPSTRADASGPPGEVAEWSNAPHSKCGIRATVSGVESLPLRHNLTKAPHLQLEHPALS